MPAALKILQIALSLLPGIIDLIRKLESLFPQTGQGPKKLQIVQAMLETTYKTAGDVGVGFDEVWPVVSSGIGAVVKVPGIFDEPKVKSEEPQGG